MSSLLCQASLALGRWTMLVGKLTPVFHLVDLEVTSGAAVSYASLR